MEDGEQQSSDGTGKGQDPGLPSRETRALPMRVDWRFSKVGSSYFIQ